MANSAHLWIKYTCNLNEFDSYRNDTSRSNFLLRSNRTQVDLDVKNLNPFRSLTTINLDQSFDNSNIRLVYKIKLATKKLLIQKFPTVLLLNKSTDRIDTLEVRNFNSSVRLAFGANAFASLDKNITSLYIKGIGRNSTIFQYDSKFIYRGNLKKILFLKNLTFINKQSDSAQIPNFKFPNLTNLVLKSISYIKSSKFKCKIECSCFNLTKIRRLNPKLRIYIDGEKCDNTSGSKECRSLGLEKSQIKIRKARSLKKIHFITKQF